MTSRNHRLVANGQRSRSISRGPSMQRGPLQEKTGDFAGGPMGGSFKPPFRLKEGDIVQGGKFQWKIGTSLGEGGSGAVYKSENDGKSYAVKIELQEANRSLKIEIALLSDFVSVYADQKSHFPDLMDQGQSNKLNFIVLNMVGPCVWDIRKYLFCPDDFSKSTSMQVSLQALEALEQLHAIGWLHRDMKLQNLCVGLEEKQNTLFLLDFGIAKRFREKEGRHVERKKVPLAGTARYMSIAAMMGMEQSRKDDLESWIYVMFCTFDDEKGNPWRCYNPKHQFDAICSMKQAFMKGNYEKKWFLNEVPLLLKMKPIVAYVGQLGFEEEPDYKKIRLMLLAIAEASKINLKKKLDWVGKMDEYEKARHGLW